MEEYVKPVMEIDETEEDIILASCKSDQVQHCSCNIGLGFGGGGL